jgi:hypothetical protein
MTPRRPHVRKSGSVLNSISCIVSVAMSDDAVRFRKQAEKAREYADRAYSPIDKEAWLRVAELA